MKKILFLFITVLTMISCADEDNDIFTLDETKTIENTNLAIDAKKDNNGYLVGVASKEMFSEDNIYKLWFNPNYNNYTPNVEVLAKLKVALKNIKIRAYMGTWCPDSKREVPKLYKILDEIEFTNFDMIGVNTSKEANGLEVGYGYPNKTDKLKVATFILYKDGKELGRFIESENGSLEDFLLKIALK